MKKSGVGLQSHPGGETIIDKHEEAEDEDGGVVDLAQEKAEDNIDGSQSKRSAAQRSADDSSLEKGGKKERTGG